MFRRLNPLSLLAILALLGLLSCQTAVAQTAIPAPPVAPQPVLPGHSTSGLFEDNGGMPVYGVTNLSATVWNGVPVITGDLFDFQTMQIEFFVAVPFSPGSVVWVAGNHGGWADANDGTGVLRWGDNVGRSGVYIPL